MHGDHVEELYFLHSDRSQTAPATRELRIIDGGPADVWRRFGRWLPAADFDDDGTVDLISAPENEQTPTAVSGRDGRLLWRADHPWSRYAQHEPRTHATQSGRQGDFNGDGLSDVVVLAKGRGMRWTKQLMGLSGSDGSRLCVANGIPGLTDLLSLQLIDTDADARPEIWALFTTLGPSPDSTPALAMCLLDARDGRTIWQRTLCSWNATDHIGWQLRLDPVCVDLNGDQVMAYASGTGPSGKSKWSVWMANCFGKSSCSVPTKTHSAFGHQTSTVMVTKNYCISIKGGCT